MADLISRDDRLGKHFNRFEEIDQLLDELRTTMDGLQVMQPLSGGFNLDQLGLMLHSTRTIERKLLDVLNTGLTADDMRFKK